MINFITFVNSNSHIWRLYKVNAPLPKVCYLIISYSNCTLGVVFYNYLRHTIQPLHVLHIPYLYVWNNSLKQHGNIRGNILAVLLVIIWRSIVSDIDYYVDLEFARGGWNALLYLAGYIQKLDNTFLNAYPNSNQYPVQSVISRVYMSEVVHEIMYCTGWNCGRFGLIWHSIYSSNLCSTWYLVHNFRNRLRL